MCHNFQPPAKCLEKTLSLKSAGRHERPFSIKQQRWGNKTQGCPLCRRRCAGHIKDKSYYIGNQERVGFFYYYFNKIYKLKLNDFYHHSSESLMKIRGTALRLCCALNPVRSQITRDKIKKKKKENKKIYLWPKTLRMPMPRESSTMGPGPSCPPGPLQHP